MLTSVESPSPKTAMMYGARLCYAQLRHYHDYLEKRGLIVQVDGLWVEVPTYRNARRLMERAQRLGPLPSAT